ncbi:hypothetical protein KBB05_01140 [Patescibacteria group bacterium]|nr:hypothetical protein [Patescibacteria group bacterium]
MGSIVKIIQDDHIINPKPSDQAIETMGKQPHSENQDQNEGQREASENHVRVQHDQSEEEREVRRNEDQLVDEIDGEGRDRDVNAFITLYRSLHSPAKHIDSWAGSVGMTQLCYPERNGAKFNHSVIPSGA